MVCKKCGKEFEGTVCPDCGGQAEETAQKRLSPSAPEGAAVLYGILRYAGAVLFMLYAALLFAFYAAPLGTVFGISLGSVYALDTYRESAPLFGVCVSLIVFGAVMAVAGAFLLIPSLRRVYKGTKLRIRGKCVPAEKFITFFILALYAVMLIVSIAAMAAVGGEELEIGAAPILVMVFSVVFAGVTVGAFVWRNVLAKADPSLPEREAEDGEAQRAARRARSIAYEKEFAKTQKTEPYLVKEEPVPVPKPTGYDEVNALARFDRFLLFFAGGILLPFLLIAMIAFSMDVTQERRMLFFWLLCAAVWLVGILTFAFCAATRPKHKVTEFSVRSPLNALLWALWPIAAAVAAFGIFYLFAEFAPSSAGMKPGSQLWTWFTVVFIILLACFLLSAWIVRPRLRGDVKFAFYGSTRPKASEKPQIGYADYAAGSRAYIDGYNAVNAAKTRQDARARLFVPLVATAVAAVVLIAALVPAFSFSLPKALRSLRPGDAAESVTELCGEPYSGTGSSSYVYYSGAYLSILQKWENYDPESAGSAEEALQDAVDMAKDMERLRTMDYTYAEITFESTGVVSVLYDASRNDSKGETEKTVKEAEALSEDGAYTYYTVEYTDGSYYLGRAQFGDEAEKIVYNPFGDTIPLA